jgi:hypothetical protein
MWAQYVARLPSCTVGQVEAHTLTSISLVYSARCLRNLTSAT